MLLRMETNGDTNLTPQAAVLLVLARRADSLCPAIQSWALRRGWGDLLLCESAYEAMAHLDDQAPDTPVFVLGRPDRLTPPFLTAARRRHRRLQVIAWDRPAAFKPPHAFGRPTAAPMIRVSSLHELTATLAVLTPDLSPPAPASHAERHGEPAFDPAQYRLSSDEINALLGSE